MSRCAVLQQQSFILPRITKELLLGTCGVYSVGMPALSLGIGFVNLYMPTQRESPEVASYLRGQWGLSAHCN